MSEEHSFKVGDKIRCVSTNHTYRTNRKLIQIGRVYTIWELQDEYKLVLQEVEDEHATMSFYFHYKDFTKVLDTDEAWDRAMGVV